MSETNATPWYKSPILATIGAALMVFVATLNTDLLRSGSLFIAVVLLVYAAHRQFKRLRVTAFVGIAAITVAVVLFFGAKIADRLLGVPAQNDGARKTELIADLEYRFWGRDTLNFTFFNQPSSLSSARNPRVIFGLMDVSNPLKDYPAPEHDMRVAPPLPIPFKFLSDYVRPGESVGRYEVFDPISKSHIQRGDRIWGFATLTCENCKQTRHYYIYWVLGEGGWYTEVPKEYGQKIIKISPPRPLSDKELSAFIERTLPANTIRTIIPASRFDIKF